MSTPNADNIIYNFSLYNNEDAVIPAERYITRDTPFVNKVENYYVRLIGFSISSVAIPLFVYNNDMTVTINNNGVSSTVNVVFEILFANEPRSIIFIQQFLNGINNALLSAHNNCGAPGNAPIVVYDRDYITFIIDQQYLPQQQQIYFNDPLVNKFPALFSRYNPILDLTEIKYGNFGNNLYNTYEGGITYPCYVIRCGTTSYKTLQQFSNILLVSNSMAVNKQLLSNATSGSQSLGIVAIIDIDFDNLVSGTPIQHIDEIQVYNDILDSGHLNTIDFKLYLVDNNYGISPLFLTPGSSVTVRYEFINKEIVKNYYPGAPVPSHALNTLPFRS